MGTGEGLRCFIYTKQRPNYKAYNWFYINIYSISVLESKNITIIAFIFTIFYISSNSVYIIVLWSGNQRGCDIINYR